MTENKEVTRKIEFILISMKGTNDCNLSPSYLIDSCNSYEEIKTKYIFIRVKTKKDINTFCKNHNPAPKESVWFEVIGNKIGKVRWDLPPNNKKKRD